MGRALAELHLALADYPTAVAPAGGGRATYAAALQGIDVLLGRLAAIEPRGEEEDWAVERLRSRADWLRGRPEPDLPDVAGDEQLVHGDYHDGNLFFSQRRVSAVIDWDKAEVRSRAQEAIRAMEHSLALDPGLCGAFVAGYRSAAALPDDDLERASARHGHLRVCDLWLFEAIYLEGDDRPRRFLTPGRFIPFAERWAPVAAALAAG
jgi:homoserine kinase type II